MGCRAVLSGITGKSYSQPLTLTLLSLAKLSADNGETALVVNAIMQMQMLLALLPQKPNIASSLGCASQSFLPSPS